MKKILSLMVIAAFLFSIIPAGFAAESDDTETSTIKTDTTIASKDSSGSGDSTDKDDEKDDSEEKDEVRTRTEIRTIAGDRIRTETRINDGEVRIKSELRIGDVKSRVESRLKIAGVREETRLKVVARLSDAEIKKFNALSRARFKEHSTLNEVELKDKLSRVRIKTVIRASDLSERQLPEQAAEIAKQNFERAKANHAAALERMKDARAKFAEATTAGDNDKKLEHAKAYIARASDAIIGHLEKIKARIQESDNIADDKAAEMIANIDSQIAEIQDLKVQAESATTLAEVKKIARDLNQKWKRIKHSANSHANSVVAAKVKGLVNQGRVLEAKLDKIVAGIEEKGIEIDIEAEITEFSAKIAGAKDNMALAKDKIQQALDLASDRPAANERIKALNDEAKDLLDEARRDIREAHEILKDIVKKIRSADADAELDIEDELEIAEEEEEDDDSESDDTTGDSE